ncbi:MAG: hypothetical protein RR277_05225, partial [Rikenellaceae bacterium]
GLFDVFKSKDASKKDLEQGLQKTKESVLQKIKKAIIGKSSVDDELLGAAGHYVDDIGQIGQISLIHLNQAQALRRIAVQAGTN